VRREEDPAGGAPPQGLDDKLTEQFDKYAAWMKEGRIPAAGRVIPVGKSLQAKQWILPTEQARELLRNSRLFAVAPCTCRSYYQRCDNPVETCLVTNDAAEAFLAEGRARRITLEEAEKVLEEAARHGLIHMAAYNATQHVFAVCSCCQCCCYHLQLLKHTAGSGWQWILHSDYVARHIPEKCDGCASCAERCLFGAIERTEDGIVFHSERCYGCGHCVAACPHGAFSLQLRDRPGLPG